MKAAEVRLLCALPVATLVVVAAACIPGLGRAGAMGESLRQAAIPATAGAGCAVLGALALGWYYRSDGRRTLKSARNAILSSDAEELPVAHPAAELIADVRSHLADLRTKVQQLQVQKKSLEIQLRLADAARRQAEALIQGITDAVMVTNTFDELVVANPAAAEIFHFDLARAERKPVADLVAEPRLLHDIRDLRQNHSRNNRRNLEVLLTQDGRPRQFAVSMSSVLDNAGEPCGIVTVLHDTTREREVSEMKSEFVSHVSHELRTPLSSIKAYAELLVDGEAADDKTRQDFYHVIQAEADRLSRLIDNILNISRIEAGMTRVNRKPVSLAAILKEVLDVAAPAAREKDITLLDQGVPVFFQVEADRDMIYQACLNLVSNAIKYTPRGGTVKTAIAVDEHAGQADFSVTDTGVGIPPEAMGRLFEKFYRVEQNKAMAHGSGLGLNLTRQIIEAIHKGKMHVSSEVGKGSTFGFTLPILQ